MFSIPQLNDIIELPENKPFHNVSVLHEKYVEKGASLRQIAREFLCSKSAVRNALVQAGIPIRTNEETGPSTLPFGKKRTKGKMVEHSVEQKVIMTIVEMKDDGISYEKIARFLTKAGVPTRTRRKKWQPMVVRKIYLKAKKEKTSSMSN